MDFFKSADFLTALCQALSMRPVKRESRFAPQWSRQQTYFPWGFVGAADERGGGGSLEPRERFQYGNVSATVHINTL